MGTSPKNAKKGLEKSPIQPSDSLPNPIDPASINKNEDTKIEVTEPLAPPPRPAPADYFSGAHGHLNYETNPFEHSFAGGNGANGGGLQTPGGTKLPSVAALTSPSVLLGATGTTPGFWGGLRSGPLSPAMLSGPQKDDYFGDSHHLRGGFPTPNESGLRSGLTPGGGGSMFPDPSPGAQAIFNSIASGGATPTTLDFHRTAMNAAAAQKREQHKVTSQPQEISNTIEAKPPMPGHFDQHDANDAANGLFLLAQARNGPNQQTNHYAPAPQMPVLHAHPQINMHVSQPSDISPNMGHRNGGSISTNSARGVSEISNGFSDEQEQTSRPNTRGKGKRGAQAQANGRRKGEEPPAKAPAAKKSKANNGHAMEPEPEPQSEEELDMNKDEYNANGKKMTDEEKRKNFLERNRVAALKCRQRKKQWLANLQTKVEMFSSENDSLSAQISQLREEVVNLKTLLLAHKDCAVGQQQGLQNIVMPQHMMDPSGFPMGPGQMHPYGMNMNQQQVMAGPMQPRRFS